MLLVDYILYGVLYDVATLVGCDECLIVAISIDLDFLCVYAVNLIVLNPIK